MTVVSLETSLQGAMWSVAALRTQCLQVSIQQAMGLASGCLYVTWKTWGQGCLSHLALPGGQGRGHQVVSRNWHVRAGSRHCPHHARIGGLPVWSYGSVRGTSPVALSAGLQPEVPVAGIADQNWHRQPSNRKLIITSFILSSTSVLVRLHEDPPQMGKRPPACTRIKTEKRITRLKGSICLENEIFLFCHLRRLACPAPGT